MVATKVVTGYLPRPYQELLHNEVKRFNVLVCHRRFGKTVFSINEMIDRALRNTRRNPRYAYIAPTYQQAKRIAWDMLKDYTRPIPGVSFNETELRVDIHRPNNGDSIRITLLGAENPDSIRGIYLDGMVLDEYAQCDPAIWGEVIRPALTDRKGWAIFIGTPKGQNHFYDIYQTAKKAEGWYTAIFKASETGVVDPYELSAAKSTMTDEEYEQEFQCSFTAALVGAYYGKIINEIEEKKQIIRVPYDHHLPVDTFWDLGIGDACSIWFIQSLRAEFHVIDYVENSGEALDWYVRALIEGDRKKWIYREHVMPHDAAAREFQTGKSRQAAFRDLTGKTPIVLPRFNVDDGINEVRQVLHKCYFDEIKTERGLNALRNYERKWDAKNKLFSSKPLHNWASNGADAFRAFAMHIRPEGDRMENKSLPTQAIIDYNIFDI